MITQNLLNYLLSKADKPWLQYFDQSNSLCARCCSNHSPEWHLWYAYFSKAHRRLSSSENYKRTWQGALAVLLLYLYKYNMVCATIMCLSHVYLLCFYLKATMPYPCALISYSLISVIMYAPYVHHEELLSLDIIPNPNSF